ncbi:Ubiquitin-40S ribosomal S27a protein [Rutstroemia sp. NJR-2017a BBW]|nr:Ubiquitin-40S ribosomal S27a protein [Rutstroemia sp. NJR-2017a BBW]
MGVRRREIWNIEVVCCRKKTKLAVLKYYKVDGDGKIERLRRECPTPDCGAGVFMAAMHDRQYCGRCHLTYIFDNEK